MVAAGGVDLLPLEVNPTVICLGSYPRRRRQCRGPRCHVDRVAHVARTVLADGANLVLVGLAVVEARVRVRGAGRLDRKQYAVAIYAVVAGTGHRSP